MLGNHIAFMKPVGTFCIGVFLLTLPLWAGSLDEFGQTFSLYGGIGLTVIGLIHTVMVVRDKDRFTVEKFVSENKRIAGLPLAQREALFFKGILIFIPAIIFLTGLISYDLVRVEYYGESASVWAPAAFVYELAGFWPSVLLVPGSGVMLVVFGLVSLRKQRAKQGL